MAKSTYLRRFPTAGTLVFYYWRMMMEIELPPLKMNRARAQQRSIAKF
jgi:hypothetical protein